MKNLKLKYNKGGAYFMKSNLCVVGLAPEFTINISKMLAYKLDMFYASVNEMLEFDLINVMEAKQIVGSDYIETLENDKLKTLFSFDNAIITMDMGMFLRGDNAKVVNEAAYIIFLDIPYNLLMKLYKKEENKPEDFDSQMLVYNERGEFCRNICDFQIEIDCLNKRKIINQILQDLASHKYN